MPGVDGPGGVLVFAENWVLYRNEGHPELRVPIPRREFFAGGQGRADRGVGPVPPTRDDNGEV